MYMWLLINCYKDEMIVCICLINRFYRLASPGSSVLTYQLKQVREGLQSSMARSTVEEVILRKMITMSTAMTHHKTTGPLYHHFLSVGLVWVNSMAS